MVSNTHSHPPLQGNRARCRKLTSHNLTLITCATFENRVLYQTFQFFPANRKKRQQNKQQQRQRKRWALRRWGHYFLTLLDLTVVLSDSISFASVCRIIGNVYKACKPAWNVNNHGEKWSGRSGSKRDKKRHFWVWCRFSNRRIIVIE